jgi:hypothetical protein
MHDNLDKLDFPPLLFGVHYQLESATPRAVGHWGEICLYYLEYITRQNLPLHGVRVVETILCKGLAKHGIICCCGVVARGTTAIDLD